MLLQDVVINEIDVQVKEVPDGKSKRQFTVLNKEVYRLDVTNREQIYDGSFLAEWIAMSNQSPDDFE